MDLNTFFIDKGKKGLANIGSTCYINTAVQCLSYCLDFLHYVLSGRYKMGRDLDSTNLMNELRSIYYEMWLNNHSLIPRKFINSLRHKITELTIHHQNDIHEFLSMLLDKLNSEICYIYNFNKEELFEKNKYTDSAFDLQRFKMDTLWYEKNKKEYSEMLELFYGQSITQIICGHCNNITHNYELYSIMLLPLDNTCETLHDCLGMYFRDELLNNGDIDWKCDECKNKSVSKKIFRLWKNPKVLIITLKRFNANGVKNTKPIKIPTTLDLNNYTLLKSTKKYTLKSVAYHIGTNGYGHYYGLCKHPDGKWYNVDDLTVQEEEDPNFENGYVFFYSL